MPATAAGTRAPLTMSSVSIAATSGTAAAASTTAVDRSITPPKSCDPSAMASGVAAAQPKNKN